MICGVMFVVYSLFPFEFSLLSPSGNFLDSKSSKVSSNISKKSNITNTKSAAKKSDTANAPVQKGKKKSMVEAHSTQASNRSTDHFTSVEEKDRCGSDEGFRDSADSKHSDDMWSDSSYASTSNVSGGSSINGAEYNIASDVQNMSLTDKSGNSVSSSARKLNSPAQYKPEKWMLPQGGVDGGLTQLNLAIVSRTSMSYSV